MELNGIGDQLYADKWQSIYAGTLYTSGMVNDV